MQPDLQERRARGRLVPFHWRGFAPEACPIQQENSSAPSELSITYDYRQAAGLVPKGLAEHDFPEPVSSAVHHRPGEDLFGVFCSCAIVCPSRSRTTCVLSCACARAW